MSHRSEDRRRGGFESPWAAADGSRQPEIVRLERDSYIVLQHVYTVTEASPGVPVNGSRIGLELGFAEDEASRLIRYLNWVGYMKQSAAGPHLTLAEEGIDYLEHRAGRRHSVRAPADQPLPLPIFLD